MTDRPPTEQEVRYLTWANVTQESFWRLREDWLRLQERLAEVERVNDRLDQELEEQFQRAEKAERRLAVAMASRERWTRRTMQRSAQLAEARAALDAAEGRGDE